MDGTLIDPRQRLYTLFCELAPESTLSFAEYWHHKRSRMPQHQMLQQLLGYSDARINAFHDAWMDKIEEQDRLDLDVPFPGVDAFLKQTQERVPLCLVTARQHPDRLAAQLTKLGWLHLFSSVLATGQRQSKAAMIRAHCPYSSDDVLVGDTGEDILAGKELGIRTVAVASGALPESELRRYDPDRVIPTVVELLDDERPPLPAGAVH